jgi:hypothetical protein
LLVIFNCTVSAQCFEGNACGEVIPCTYCLEFNIDIYETYLNNCNDCKTVWEFNDPSVIVEPASASQNYIGTAILPGSGTYSATGKVISGSGTVLFQCAGEVVGSAEICDEPIPFCLAAPGPGSIGHIPGLFQSNSNTGPYFIRVYVNVVRRPDGTGGQSNAAIDAAFERLKLDFTPHNIFFVRDCEIINILAPTNDYYDGSFYAASLMDMPNLQHDDGINFFFGPDEVVGNGFGSAYIVSNRMSVTGIWPKANWVNGVLEPFPVSISSTVSHEMGHCLGLQHTGESTTFDPINSCCELVNGSNGLSCGDFVPDTDADPRFWESTITTNGCDFNFTASNNGTCFSSLDIPYRDLNGQIYTPPVNNLMAPQQVIQQCIDGFTDGQGLRMRQIIAMSPVLQACLVQPDMVDVIVTTNTTWTITNTPNNGDFVLDGDLTIEPGATLTIDPGVTIHFGEQSKLIIKPNGQLLLSGTLTGLGACSQRYTWQGVKVWGSLPGNTQAVVNGIRAQGRIECNPGSLIENAKVGVQLYGPAYLRSGGQIRCFSSTFRNCKIAVEFAPYQNVTPGTTNPVANVSSFVNTNFDTDNLYPHQERFHSFLHMTGVDGILFYGCKLRNTQNTTGADIADYGYGVFANDAGFEFSPSLVSSFYGLGYGIYTARIVRNRPYRVRSATFENCFVGIRNLSVTGATIERNKFLMGSISSQILPPTKDRIGIVFETDVNGFRCEQNEFRNLGGQTPRTIGTICLNTGSLNKTIRRNRYYSLAFGNLANDQNANMSINDPGIRGLYYVCNQHFNVTRRDIAVPNGKIRDRQGVEVNLNGIIVYNATGNHFSYTGIDISNFGPSIEYYYDPSGPNQTPIVVEGNVVPIQAPESGCPEEILRDSDDITALKSSYATHLANYLDAKANYNTEANDQYLLQMAYAQRIMDETAYNVVSHAMYDSINYSQDTLQKWISKLNSREADIWLANEFLAQQDELSTISLLNSLNTKYQLSPDQQNDLTNYQGIVNLLNGESPYQLPTATQAILANFVHAGGSTEAWAKAIATLYGKHFPLEYVTDGIDERMENMTKLVGFDDVSIAPNPAKTYVQFSFTATKNVQHVSLSIFDTNGKRVHFQPQVSAMGHYIWRTENLPAGIYYYHVQGFEIGGSSGKIVLLK